MLAVLKLLLKFIVFSNLFTQKRSFQTQNLLGGDIDFYQNFQLDCLSPEEVHAASPRLGPHMWDGIWLTAFWCFTNHFHSLFKTVVHQMKSLLGWPIKRLHATSNPMSPIIKFQLNKMHWESKNKNKKNVFYVREILHIKFISKNCQSMFARCWLILNQRQVCVHQRLHCRGQLLGAYPVWLLTTLSLGRAGG